MIYYIGSNKDPVCAALSTVKLEQHGFRTRVPAFSDLGKVSNIFLDTTLSVGNLGIIGRQKIS
jgi:hypothetical protein